MSLTSSYSATWIDFHKQLLLCHLDIKSPWGFQTNMILDRLTSDHKFSLEMRKKDANFHSKNALFLNIRRFLVCISVFGPRQSSGFTQLLILVDKCTLNWLCSEIGPTLFLVNTDIEVLYSGMCPTDVFLLNCTPSIQGFKHLYL